MSSLQLVCLAVYALPLTSLLGAAAVVGLTAACAADPVNEVTIVDPLEWKAQEKWQLVGVILLLRTGWSARWPDRKADLGTATGGSWYASGLGGNRQRTSTCDGFSRAINSRMRRGCEC